MTPGQHYMMENWWQIHSAAASPEVDLRIIFRDAAGQWLSGIEPAPVKALQPRSMSFPPYRLEREVEKDPQVAEKTHGNSREET